jgi:hypothetical protein
MIFKTLSGKLKIEATRILCPSPVIVPWLQDEDNSEATVQWFLIFPRFNHIICHDHIHIRTYWLIGVLRHLSIFQL